MKVNLSESPETMGIFGFSWQEKSAAFMQKRLKGTEYESKLKSFWGAGGKNVEMVNNLHLQYMALMARGYNPVSFSIAPDAAGNNSVLSADSILLTQEINKATGVDKAIINEFLISIFVLARDGKMPYEKFNPKGYNAATAITKETFVSEQSILDKITPTASKNISTFLVVAGIGVSAYLLSQIKGFVK